MSLKSASMTVIYPDSLQIIMDKCQEGKGAWCELRFRYAKIELIATGGLCNTSDGKLGAFLGVSAPSHMALDTGFILFSPTSPQEALSCPRMLRNYRKQASMKQWCFKSSFFLAVDFATPDQLRLHERGSSSYVQIFSKLLSIALERSLVEADYNSLEDDMKKVEKQSKKKLSLPKQLLAEVIASRKPTVSNQNLMFLYNGVIAPKVRALNKKAIKKMMK